MGCDITVEDKYDTCAFLIDEYKLIAYQYAEGNYTEKEYEVINAYKKTKEDKIEKLLKEIDDGICNKQQRLRYIELYNNFNKFIEMISSGDDSKSENN